MRRFVLLLHSSDHDVVWTEGRDGETTEEGEDTVLIWPQKDARC